MRAAHPDISFLQALIRRLLAKYLAPRPGKQRKARVGRCLAAAVFDKMLLLRRY
jgi:hypothetical protein